MFQKKADPVNLSNAHLELLSKFRNDGKAHDINPETWNSILGENVQELIKRFEMVGLIKEADLLTKIECSYKLPELKEILKKNGSGTSGKKHDLAERVFQLNNQNITRLLNDQKILTLTEMGERIVGSYLESKQISRIETENRVIDSLKKRDLPSACKAMAEFEAKQVFSRGMGIDWGKYNPRGDIIGLQAIFSNPPKYLSNLSKNTLESLQLAGAMKYLWGVGDGSEWLPEDFSTDLPFSNKVAINMLCSRAYSQRSMSNYIANNDVVTGVKIFVANDCCDECKNLEGKQYKLMDAPLLPYENCTSESGCRCCYIPLVD